MWAILVAFNARIYKYFIWEQHTTNMPGNWYEYYWYWRTYQLGYDMKQYQALLRYHKLVWETEVIPCIYTSLYSSINTRFIPAIYEAKKISLGPNTKYQSGTKDFQKVPIIHMCWIFRFCNRKGLVQPECIWHHHVYLLPSFHLDENLSPFISKWRYKVQTH